MLRILWLQLALSSVSASQRLTSSDHATLVGPYGVDPLLDCATRNFTWTFALSLLPSRSPLVSVFDALRLTVDCNQTRPVGGTAEGAWATHFELGGEARVLRSIAPPPGAVFADPVGGSDAKGAGTQSSPFRTIARALAATRGAGGGGAIVLRAGMFEQSTTLVLGPLDSGLSISAYPGEAPVLSGGVLMSPLSWTRVGPSPNATLDATVWQAPLPARVVAPFSTLFNPQGRRAVRARYPNGNPEELSGLLPNGYTKAASWSAAPTPLSPLVQQRPLLNTEPRSACPPDACSATGPSGAGPPWAIFCCFFWAHGSTVENFTRGSFWGSHPGPPGGSTFASPGGVVVGPDLLPRLAGWATPTDAIVHAFQSSYWGNWQWPVDSIDATSGAFVFGAGGWQEARGASTGDYMYVENVREELDAPGEWWVDVSARTLFYVANGTGAPSPDGWIAGQTDNVLTLAGTPAAPVVGVSLSGLTFAFTEPTFLKPFSASGGGDWSFQDGGALRLTGTGNCSVYGSLFFSIGGNGVMLSGWNKGASVTDSEFQWVGESAVVSGGDPSAHDCSAIDAPVGEGLLLARNLAHELGLFVKQSGFLYSTMSANTSVLENVFFNGPRSGICLNDAMGGGHSITKNAAFNLVRESSDHGPFK
jgi:hypothetical protein